MSQLSPAGQGVMGVAVACVQCSEHRAVPGMHDRGAGQRGRTLTGSLLNVIPDDWTRRPDLNRVPKGRAPAQR